MTSPIYNNNIGSVGTNNIDNTKEPKYDSKQQPNTVFQPQQVPVETTSKMPELDYTSFPKKLRAYANDIATRSMNEVKDLVRDFNKNYPATTYNPPYEEFPKPESYSAKNLGGKEAAFNAWKDAVKEWVEDCKQDLQSLKDTGMQDIQKQMQENFITSWTLQGLALETIMEVLERHNNDTKAALQELKNLVQKEGAKTRKTVEKERNHIKEAIAFNATEIEYAIETESKQIKDKMDSTKKEEAEKAELKEKINLALRNEPTKTKRTIREVIESKGLRFDKNSKLDAGGNSNIPEIIDELDKGTLEAIVAMLTEVRNPWTR